MSLASLIRQYPDKPAALVAQVIGCSAQTVRNVRWRDENAETVRRQSRRHARSYQTRLGIQPGAQKSRMTPALTAEVIRLRSGGMSQSQVAKSLGLTIGQVAGTMHLYRKRIEKGAAGGNAR